MTGWIRQVRTFLREQGLATALEVAFNFVGPWVVYHFSKAALGEVGALMASSGPPILWSVIEFVRRRRVDAISLLVLGGIVMSLLAFFGGGGVTFLQLREKMVTAVVGLVFLGSAAIGKPLIYTLAHASMRRKGGDDLADFEAVRDQAVFRRIMTVMTIVWGAGLIIDAAVSASLVFVLPIGRYLIVSPIVGYVTVGLLTLWTVWYVNRARRKGERKRGGGEPGPPPPSDIKARE